MPVKTNSKKKIRVFPLTLTNQQPPRLRTNETYDAFISAYQNQYSKNDSEIRNKFHGHIRPCILRDLKYFDVGTGFVSDSLHNVYHGVMVNCIHQYFDQESMILKIVLKSLLSFR